MDTDRLQLALKAGATYFALVFAAGFALGTVRVLWLLPRLGERTGELLEMPLMLVVCMLAALWIIRRFALPALPGLRLTVGFIALMLLIAAELTLVLGVRGLSLAEYIASRDPVSGIVYLAMLCIYALMPFLLSWRRNRSDM